MVKGEEWFMIENVYRQGLSITEISRRTGRDRKTECCLPFTPTFTT